MLRALKVEAFRRLAALYPVDGLLDWASSIALMVLVFDQTGSALATGALLVFKQIVPGLLTPVAGRRLDAVPIGRAVGIAMLLRAAAVGAAAAAGEGIALYVLALVAGLGGTLSRATFRAGVARMLDGDDRRAGNALLNTAMGLVSLGGPAAAGLALTVVSPIELLQATAVVGVVAGLAAFVVVPSVGAAAADAEGAEPRASATAPSAEDAHEAEAWSRSPAPVVPVTVMLALATVIFTAFAMDEPSLLPYATESLGDGVGAYGAILSLWGLGIIVGSVLFARMLDRSMVVLAAVGTAIGALGYIGLGLAPNLAVAGVIAVLGGVGNGFNWVALVTAVQEASPAAQQGRVAARLEAIATVGPGVGYLIGGAVADALDPRLTLLIPGVLALLLLAGAALIYGPRLRLAAARAEVDAAVAAVGADA